MGRCFDQPSAFPIIARIIRELHPGGDRFVSKDEIVARLLSDPAGRSELEEARRRCPNRTTKWLAGNMVAWFGQTWTTGHSSYDREFHRTRTKPYGYRPKVAGDACSTGPRLNDSSPSGVQSTSAAGETAVTMVQALVERELAEARPRIEQAVAELRREVDERLSEVAAEASAPIRAALATLPRDGTPANVAAAHALETAIVLAEEEARDITLRAIQAEFGELARDTFGIAASDRPARPHKRSRRRAEA